MQNAVLQGRLGRYIQNSALGAGYNQYLPGQICRIWIYPALQDASLILVHTKLHGILEKMLPLRMEKISSTGLIQGFHIFILLEKCRLCESGNFSYEFDSRRRQHFSDLAVWRRPPSIASEVRFNPPPSKGRD